MQNNKRAGVGPVFIPREHVFYIIGFLLFIIFRVYSFKQLVAPVSSPDTPSFIAVSTLSLLDPGFWAGAKPFLYPLLIKIFGGSLHVIPVVQLLISITSWGFLAYSFSSFFNDLKFKVLAFLILLVFATNILLVPWDAAIMSESLSFSLLALMIGLWLFYIKHRTGLVTLALILASCSWIFLRDSNAWMGLAIGGVLLLVWLFQKSRQVLVIGVILCSAFLANYLLGGLIVNMEQRWVIPMLNVIEKRILKNADRVKYFQAHGMPVSPALMAMKDQDYNGNNNAFYNSPDLETFREWLLKDGRRTYILFLLHNPDYLLVRPFMDVGYLTERENKDIYQPTFFSYPLLPSWINEIALLDIDPGQLMIGSVVFSGLALAFLVARRNGFWLILTTTLVLAYPHLVVAWQGDSAGLSRHTLLANLQVRLAVWMVLLAFMNEVFISMNKFKKVKGSGIL